MNLQATKQDNSAHVILATSDYAFLDWLTGGNVSFALALRKAVIAYAH